MSSTPRNHIPVERLGAALDALGWHPSEENPQAASREEMLGLLRFIVEAELYLLADDEEAENKATEGYMIGLHARAKSSTSTDHEYAVEYITHWMNLIAENVNRTGSEVMTAVQSVDKGFGTAQIAPPLMHALKHLLLVPGTVDRDTGKAGSPRLVKVTLKQVSTFLREARKYLEDSQRKLKQEGF